VLGMARVHNKRENMRLVVIVHLSIDEGIMDETRLLQTFSIKILHLSTLISESTFKVLCFEM